MSERSKFLTLSAVESRSTQETHKRETTEHKVDVAAHISSQAKDSLLKCAGEDSLLRRPAWMQQQTQHHARDQAKDSRPRRLPVSGGGGAAASGSVSRSLAVPSGNLVGSGTIRAPSTPAPAPGCNTPKRSASRLADGKGDSDTGLIDLCRPTTKRPRGSVPSGSSACSAAGNAMVASTASPAKSGSTFDITAILEGRVKGQAVAGAHRTLKSLQGANNAKKRQALAQEITIAETAHKISPQNIEKLPLAALQAHMTFILQNHSPGLPLVTHAVHLKKCIESHVGRVDAEATFAAIRPWTLHADLERVTRL